MWLPLPHLLNALPVQIDLFYRTGLSAVALSVISFAAATSAIAWIIATVTSSNWAGAAGASVFALNPNVLYLQATPMTEPLLIALMLIAVALLMKWCTTPAELDRFLQRRGAATVGLAFALACLTRYEAWPVTVAALVAAVWTRWRSGVPLRAAVALGAAQLSVWLMVVVVKQ